MQNIPDVVGMKLENGLSILDNHGCNYFVVETLSPKATNKDGECRIINLRENATKLELIVSFF